MSSRERPIRRIIEKPSNDLLVKALETVPVSPQKFRINMAHQAISPPNANDSDSVRRYLQQCAEASVAPYFSLEQEYVGRDSSWGSDGRLVRPLDRRANQLISDQGWELEGVGAKNQVSPEIMDVAMEALLRGSRPHRIIVYAHNHVPQDEAFEVFRGHDLPRFVNNGYRIAGGHVTIGSASSENGYHVNTWERGKIWIDDERGLTLSLEDGQGDPVNMKCEPQLLEWFSSLQQEHLAETGK